MEPSNKEIQMNTNQPIKLFLTYCTKYNGVSISVDWDRAPDNFDVTDEIERSFDEVSDTLPEYTSEMADWDHEISNEDQAKLCEMATNIIRPTIPNFTIKFVYDHHSS